jgi:hypothetical protein
MLTSCSVYVFNELVLLRYSIASQWLLIALNMIIKQCKGERRTTNYIAVIINQFFLTVIKLKKVGNQLLVNIKNWIKNSS